MSDLDVQGNWADADWDEPVPFPVEPDIEYIGSIRVHRELVWKGGQRRLLWLCEHGETAETPEDAAANCVAACWEEA